MVAPPGQSRDRVLATLSQEGIVTSRVSFADRQPRLDYMKTYQQIDLCLDPLPWNGHGTGCDALWMGVPTLTLVSQQSALGRGLEPVVQRGFGGAGGRLARAAFGHRGRSGRKPAPASGAAQLVTPENGAVAPDERRTIYTQCRTSLSTDVVQVVPTTGRLGNLGRKTVLLTMVRAVEDLRALE